MRKKDCLVWTAAGTWLQTIEGDGRTRSSFVGPVSEFSARSFCERVHLDLLIDDPGKRRQFFPFSQLPSGAARMAA